MGTRARTSGPSPRALGCPSAATRGSRLGIDSLILSLKAAFDTRRAQGGRATYELRVDDHIFILDLTGGALDARRGDAPNPDATITASRDALEAVVAGDRTLADVLRAGGLRLEGDRNAVAIAKECLLAPAASAA